MLVGRADEQAQLRAVLDRAASGRFAAAVVRGEPGAGKSALLDDARARAADAGFTVLAARGHETEAEVAFAGLTGLLQPLEKGIDELPDGLADALRAALSLEPVGTDRARVSVAVFQLCAHAAERAPLLLSVDDMQWLDRASHDVLGFAARRFDADAVALVAAARPETVAFEGTDAQEVALGPMRIDDLEAIVLADGPVDRDVLRSYLALTGGNPLATRELLRNLTAAQRTGREPLPTLPKPGPMVERAFAQRLCQLAEPVRRAVAMVAADDTGEVAVVSSALESLGEDPAALEQAEDAGVLTIDGARVSFAHPLIRVAAYHQVAARSRRAAHRALATVLDAPHHAVARAWQLAAAATGPDAVAADALALVAGHAQARGGSGSAARVLERAATLTPDPAVQFERLVLAAHAWIEAGELTEALKVAGQLRERVQTEDDELAVAVLTMIAEQAPVAVETALEKALAEQPGWVGECLGARAALRAAGEAIARGDRVRANEALDLFAKRSSLARAPLTLEAEALRAQLELARGEDIAAMGRLERANALAGEDSDDVALPPADELAGLTPAELRVAQTVGAGRTNRETANELFLSVKTVDFHLQNIYRKLSVRSRAELAVLVTKALAVGGTK